MAVTESMREAMRELAEKSNPSQILMLGDTGAMTSSKSWDDETFGAMLEILVEQEDEEVGKFFARYKTFKDARELTKAIAADMWDNYVAAGIAAAMIPGIPKDLPLIAWAAFNKHQYAGFPNIGFDAEGAPGTEFALVRTLAMFGFDLDAQDDNGYTALHFFASTKVAPYTNPRAIGWLLDRGADASIKNKNGDTPLIYMAASVRWTPELSGSFIRMFQDPTCDPWATANDGKTARMVMQENDPMAPNPQRQNLIAQMERLELEGETGAAPEGKKRPPLTL